GGIACIPLLASYFFTRSHVTKVWTLPVTHPDVPAPRHPVSSTFAQSGLRDVALLIETRSTILATRKIRVHRLSDLRQRPFGGVRLWSTSPSTRKGLPGFVMDGGIMLDAAAIEADPGLRAIRDLIEEATRVEDAAAAASLKKPVEREQTLWRRFWDFVQGRALLDDILREEAAKRGRMDVFRGKEGDPERQRRIERFKEETMEEIIGRSRWRVPFLPGKSKAIE
ncbi:hypothetical protein HK101_006096, partial [Irineochytrium annulatum]